MQYIHTSRIALLYSASVNRGRSRSDNGAELLSMPGRDKGLLCLQYEQVRVVEIFFSRLLFLFSFASSLGNGSIQTELLSQRAAKQKKQPTKTANRLPILWL